MQEMEEQTTISNVIGWIQLADDDYIAARVLINNALLPQGAILSATAVEKYLKMVHQIRRAPFSKTHNVMDLYKSVKKLGVSFELNENYLLFLSKIYRFRYPDELEADFNFAVNQAKLLTALDESVHRIRKGLVIVSKEGAPPSKQQFEHWIDSNYNPLMRMNHAYCSEVAREDLFKKPSIWHEVRYVGGKAWLEMGYTGAAQDDGVYQMDGLKPGENDRQFRMQSEPIDAHLNPKTQGDM